MPLFRKKLNQITNEADFFTELHGFLTMHFGPLAKHKTVLYGSDLADLVADLRPVEPFVVHISRDLSQVEFLNDISCRIHPGYPDVSPVFSCEKIPYETIISVDWNRMERFDSAMKQIQKEMNRYSEFWQLLDEIDNELVIKGSCSKSCDFRIINVGSAQLKLKIDVWAPYQKLTDVKMWLFTGTPSLVSSLEKKIYQNSQMFSDCRGEFVSTLEKVLELKLPRAGAVCSADRVSCRICYESDAEDIIVCSCKTVYHKDCLVHAFSRQGKQKIYNAIFGQCGGCNAQIAVNIQ